MTLQKEQTVSRPPYQTDESRWRAVQQRDRRADGKFVYSVRTTGVYCRPACPARQALRRNVEFHDTPADAERGGFRPCQRCRPKEASQLERHVAAAANACRLIERASAQPTLDVLAQGAGLSRFHFHRMFKKIVGVTPRQYAAEHRAGRLKSGLRARGSITSALYGAGFSSSSRLYNRSSDLLGMTPGEYRKGGNGVEIRYAIAACRLGLVLVAGTSRGICCVRFGDNQAALEKNLHRDFPRALIEQAPSHVSAWVRAIVEHIEDPGNTIDLPLDIRGTAFQQRVWQALRKIPVGQTSTYSRIAAQIGQPSAARAVARACATNPVAIVVPCHRVVRSDGSLSGYFWGVERKRKLLEREKGVEVRGQKSKVISQRSHI